MKKVFLKPVEGGQKVVELKTGKTIIGRGPLLECSDKKVSRNHAVLEVTCDGEVILTPTHVNPCFYQAQGKGPPRVMKKDKQHVLVSGDSIALLPSSYKYIVEVTTLSTISAPLEVQDGTAPPSGESEEKDSLADKPATAAVPSEEAKKNGSVESNHNSTAKTENGDRASSEEGGPEVCTKPPTVQQRTAVSSTREAKSKLVSEGGRTLPRWLLDSASKTVTTAAAAKAVRPSQQQQSKPTAEPATPKVRQRAAKGNELVSESRKKQQPPKATVTDAKHKEEEGESGESGNEEVEEVEEEESEEEYTPKGREERRGGGGTRDSKGGRSSRQNRGTMQKISLDDFVASDDDEWGNSSEERKPRRRRKRTDDSGSDWEEENRKSKKTRRVVLSDSDSASDWERTSRKKRPATRTRTRRRRKSSSESESEEDSDNAPLQRSARRQPTKRSACNYGKKCYRRNAQHRKQFSHPGDSDFEGSEEGEEEEEEEEKEVVGKQEKEEGADEESQNHDDSDSEKEGKRPAKKSKEENSKVDDRPDCRFGAECFRKNAQHHKNFKHPPPTKKKTAQETSASKKGKRGKAKDSSNEEKASGDEYDWKDDDSDDGSPPKRATKTFAKRKRGAAVNN